MAPNDNAPPLLVQSADTVTIPVTEIPLINGGGKNELAMTVNFLRSGCPAVQIILDTISVPGWLIRLGAMIQLADERFVKRSDAELGDGFSVLVITREKL